MAYDIVPDLSIGPDRSHRWLQVILLAIFAFCLLIGVGALLLLLTMRQAAPPALSADPRAALRSELIMPQLALHQLAGDPTDGLAVQATQAGQLETARAILTYDIALPPTVRAALLAQLAHGYQAAGQSQAAAQVYRLAVPGAVLSASFAPLARAQLLTQLAEGLVAAGEKAAARTVAEQAMLVGAQTPDLLPAQRSQIFDNLRKVAEKIDDRALLAQVDDLARNPFLTPQGTLVTAHLPTITQPVAYDEATQAAVRSRQQAAKQLAERYQATKGADINPERQALAQALVAEDAARTHFYQTAQAAQLTPVQNADLQWDRLQWLLIKLRSAERGFGLSLVPEWEQQAGNLLAEVGNAFGQVAAAQDAFAAAQAAPADQAMQRVENQYWTAEQVERGLNTTAAAADIGERVRIVQDDLAKQGRPLALPVVYQATGGMPGFRYQAAPARP